MGEGLAGAQGGRLHSDSCGRSHMGSRRQVHVASLVGGEGSGKEGVFEQSSAVSVDVEGKAHGSPGQTPGKARKEWGTGGSDLSHQCCPF